MRTSDKVYLIGGLMAVLFVAIWFHAATESILDAHSISSIRPTDPDIAAMLGDVPYGGPLPEGYIPMQATVTAIEHLVERGKGSDTHTVNVSIARSGEFVHATMLLITQAGALHGNCDDGTRAGLEIGRVTAVNGCWDLPPSETPLAVVVVAPEPGRYLNTADEYEVMSLPLFGAPAAPGFGAPAEPRLVCEPTGGGTICVTAGR